MVESVTENQENTNEDAVKSEEDINQSESSPESPESPEENENWYYMPDSILLNIFQYLTPKELTIAGEICKSWHRVSRDEFLWKDLFYQTYKIDPDIGIMPG